jgi:hypothetical protein
MQKLDGAALRARERDDSYAAWVVLWSKTPFVNGTCIDKAMK